jgi:hypothetical protein
VPSGSGSLGGAFSGVGGPGIPSFVEPVFPHLNAHNPATLKAAGAGAGGAVEELDPFSVEPTPQDDVDRLLSMVDTSVVAPRRAPVPAAPAQPSQLTLIMQQTVEVPWVAIVAVSVVSSVLASALTAALMAPKAAPGPERRASDDVEDELLDREFRRRF